MGRLVHTGLGVLHSLHPPREQLCNRSCSNKTHTGTFPCGQQLVKYGCKEKAECTLCKKAHEESGSSWKGDLPKETIGHIQSAGCLGQKEVVTAAHNACIRELLQAVDMHGKTDRHMKLLTIEKESRLDTLWDQEQCTQV